MARWTQTILNARCSFPDSFFVERSCDGESSHQDTVSLHKDHDSINAAMSTQVNHTVHWRKFRGYRQPPTQRKKPSGNVDCRINRNVKPSRRIKQAASHDEVVVAVACNEEGRRPFSITSKRDMSFEGTVVNVFYVKVDGDAQIVVLLHSLVFSTDIRGILFCANQSVERDTWMDQKNEIVAQQAATIGQSVHELVRYFGLDFLLCERK